MSEELRKAARELIKSLRRDADCQAMEFNGEIEAVEAALAATEPCPTCGGFHRDCGLTFGGDSGAATEPSRALENPSLARACRFDSGPGHHGKTTGYAGSGCSTWNVVCEKI